MTTEKGDCAMSRFGFIHDKIEIKFLVLYIMARVASPIDFPTLTELTMCDEGVDYFDFAEAVAELVETGHLTLEEDRYAITDKGRRNSQICESSLPYSVRLHCDENLVKVNDALRREAQVQTRIADHEDGTATLSLTFLDGDAPLLRLELLAPGRERAAAWSGAFRADPGKFYLSVTKLLEENAHENEKK